MESKTPGRQRARVLVVGNSPIELNGLFEKLNVLEKGLIVAETAFDLKSAYARLARFKPQFILIDDNVGTAALKIIVQRLTKLSITRNVPITILKSSNYQETIQTSVFNFVLKQNLNAESLYRALMNSTKFQLAQQQLLTIYRKRKGHLLRLFGLSR
jgi:hypothetical protein